MKNTSKNSINNCSKELYCYILTQFNKDICLKYKKCMDTSGILNTKGKIRIILMLLVKCRFDGI